MIVLGNNFQLSFASFELDARVTITELSWVGVRKPCTVHIDGSNSNENNGIYWNESVGKTIAYMYDVTIVNIYTYV